MGHYMSKQLPEPINNSDYYLKKSKQPLDEITINEITETELHRLVLKLPNKLSLGPDGLSNKMLKAIIKTPLVLKNLTKCINKSIQESIFPNCLKTAEITPIFKSGDKTVASNYRPIAQLSPISKIYECSVMNQQFERENVIASTQFGFRESHSTWQPLLLTKTYIEKEIKAKNHVILISCDLAKAFDTCKTDGLLQNKVKYYCKGKKPSSWINSYYEHRKQYTGWNSEKSSVKENFPISIVQGSSLGPRMFNVYLNDIVSCSKFFKVMFADDTNFLLSMKNCKELETVANEELQIINDYFISNGLTISVKKHHIYTLVQKVKRKKA